MDRSDRRRATIASIEVVLLLAYGACTLTTVRQELIPDIEFPLATVIVKSPGDQPEQIVSNVIAPIEAATSGIVGLNSTLLTLLVIPIVYSLADGMRNRVARRFSRGPLVAAPATAGPSLRKINEAGDGE